MAKIIIRFAAPSDAQRLVNDGVLGGTPPPGSTWPDRAKKWLVEQQAGRRLMLVAEDEKGMVGTVQIVFKLPEGYSDPEAANGIDVAMIEMLRTRKGAPQGVSEQLMGAIQDVAHKRNVKTLTFCLPMEETRAIAQVKSWGFDEFRIMPEKRGMIAFFRKAVD